MLLPSLTQEQLQTVGREQAHRHHRLRIASGCSRSCHTAATALLQARKGMLADLPADRPSAGVALGRRGDARN
jgi:hypothetical protein